MIDDGDSKNIFFQDKIINEYLANQPSIKQFFRISAKTGFNIQESFKDLGEELYKQFAKMNSSLGNSHGITFLENSESKKKKKKRKFC